MKIKKEISGKVLTISTSRKENKGGIATFVNTLSGYYETFNYVASTCSRNPLIMLWYFGTCIFQLFYYIFIRRIKIVHLHGASYGSFVRKAIIINICHLLKVKIIYHIHGGAFRLFYKKYNKRNIVKKIIDKADMLIVLSYSWKHFFSSVTSEKKICVLNNMIDRPNFAKIYQHPTPLVRFLFLGRIGDHKGIFDLLEVIKDKKEELCNNFLLYVGGDGEINKLIEFVEKNAIWDLVKFEGWVFGEKKKALLSECDVYILPSYNEGLPISILEAMSYGLPIISTSVGGIPEVVFDKENGFLIVPGDKQQIGECLSYFLTHPQEVENMGRKSSALVINFYPENIIPKLNSIYEKLLH
jgi:glycosyltransferase involved in cell wall biosynthesis